jgi:nucleoside 2-deoxyribosyltransferase
MKKIFFSASLFSVADCEFNEKLTKLLRELGHQVYLSQESNADNKKEKYEDCNSQVIFNCVMDGLIWSDCVVALLEGSALDPGMCFEIGYAYAKGLPIYGLRTDIRGANDTVVNLMLTRSCNKIFTDVKSFVNFFGENV